MQSGETKAGLTRGRTITILPETNGPSPFATRSVQRNTSSPIESGNGDTFISEITSALVTARCGTKSPSFWKDKTTGPLLHAIRICDTSVTCLSIRSRIPRVEKTQTPDIVFMKSSQPCIAPGEVEGRLPLPRVCKAQRMTQFMGQYGLGIDHPRIKDFSEKSPHKSPIQMHVCTGNHAICPVIGFGDSGRIRRKNAIEDLRIDPMYVNPRPRTLGDDPGVVKPERTAFHLIPGGDRGFQNRFKLIQ